MLPPPTPGSFSDYAALAAFHYRDRRPATITRILAIRLDDRPVAVLLESLPALSCALRDRALNNRYRPWPIRQRATMLNTEIRCISRVIVHPQYRGLGLAVRLVRSALDSATTTYTEAIAAMGAVHPFFQHAGMIPYQRHPHPCDERLAAAIQTVGLSPLDLAHLSNTLDRINALPPPQKRFLTRELNTWSRQPNTPLPTLLRHARRRLWSQPIYYLHQNTHPGVVASANHEPPPPQSQITNH